MNKEKKILITIAVLCLIAIGLGITELFTRKTEPKSDIEDIGIRATDKGIAIVYIYGTIEFSKELRFLSIPSYGSDRTVSRLRQISRDKRVKAVVLRINSPGGTIGASQEIYQEILNLKNNGIPIVASMADIAASGGYYVASATDVIYANPGSLTGSIGVIAGSINLVELFRKAGISFNIFKTGSHKDMLAPWRNLSKAEKDLIQSLINGMKNQFVEDVAKGRNMKKEKILKLADGRVFSGVQAKKLGLIDKIGGMNDALNEAMKLAKLEGPPRIIYKSKKPFQYLMEIIGDKIGFDPLSVFYKEINKKENLRIYY